VKGGLDGLGFAVLNLLSFIIKSFKTCKTDSKSVFFSVFVFIVGIAEETPSADREGLPKRGECAGELVLDETGEAVGVGEGALRNDIHLIKSFLYRKQKPTLASKLEYLILRYDRRVRQIVVESGDQ
jgi:hypothetical protein